MFEVGEKASALRELPDFVIRRAVAKGHPCPHSWSLSFDKARQRTSCRYGCGFEVLVLVGTDFERELDAETP